MTVIAVKRIDKNTIKIGCDTLVTMSSYQNVDSFTKIFKINKKSVVGCSGSPSITDLFVEYSRDNQEILNKHKGKLSDINKHYRNFLNWLKENAPEFSQQDLDDNSYILVVNNNMYKICGMHINPVKSFASVGSGWVPAYNALMLGHSVKKAIKSSNNFQLHCGGKVKQITMKYAD